MKKSKTKIEEIKKGFIEPKEIFEDEEESLNNI